MGSSGKCPPLSSNALCMLRKVQSTHPPTLSSNFDFILITETWPNNCATDNAKLIPGYKFFSKSCETQFGDGRFVYVRESMPATLCQDITLNTIQDAVRVRAWMVGECFLIGCVYRALVLSKTIHR